MDIHSLIQQIFTECRLCVEILAMTQTNLLILELRVYAGVGADRKETGKNIKNIMQKKNIYNASGFPGGAVVKNLPANAGSRVRALVREDPTCHGATKPVRHNY